MSDQLHDLELVLAGVFTALYPPGVDGPERTIDVADLPGHVADMRADRDRLRAVVDALLSGAVESTATAATFPVHLVAAVMRALDVSAHMGDDR